MKRIVSVSIGSSSRDSRAEVEILGEQLVLERIGTDGDLDAAARMIQQMSTEVDAFGLGGIDLYLVCRGKRWVIRDAARLARAAGDTPVVDGSGLKHTLERRAIEILHGSGALAYSGGPGNTRVLVVAAVDRFGMAEALLAKGYDCRFGDLIFALGLPLAVRSLGAINLAATLFLPVLSRLPFTILYPTGDKQDTHSSKNLRFIQWADIIAGDFHYIRRNVPHQAGVLAGKTIITNTTTSADVDYLRECGLWRLITTTPRLQGRSFGTNVMEAAMVALSGRPADEVTPADYLELLDRMDYSPTVEVLNEPGME